ncbi:uncharacterized protein [Vicugna pacos]|uniref:Uncharacterized protein isoform X2 n=1 Tax=Vicugna pacos TaxID=30538 RepID=A0ABM5DCB8_VICPA
MDSARRWGGDFKHQREETLTCGQELHPSPSHLLWFIWMRKWRPRKAKTFAQGHTAALSTPWNKCLWNGLWEIRTLVLSREMTWTDWCFRKGIPVSA